MINADAGVFVALEKGFFRDQGLNVEVTYFSSSGGPQMAALTTGELDAGSGSISPGIYNSAAGGVRMRVVASKSRVGPRGSGRYMVRRGLLEPDSANQGASRTPSGHRCPSMHHFSTFDAEPATPGFCPLSTVYTDPDIRPGQSRQSTFR